MMDLVTSAWWIAVIQLNIAMLMKYSIEWQLLLEHWLLNSNNQFIKTEVG